MKKLRIVYFNQLGRRQLDRIVDQFKQKHSDVEITTQTDLTNECEKYFEKLQKLGLIIHNEDGTDSFNIKKYIFFIWNSFYFFAICFSHHYIIANFVVKYIYHIFIF